MRQGNLCDFEATLVYLAEFQNSQERTSLKKLNFGPSFTSKPLNYFKSHLLIYKMGQILYFMGVVINDIYQLLCVKIHASKCWHYENKTNMTYTLQDSYLQLFKLKTQKWVTNFQRSMFIRSFDSWAILSV